MRKSSPLFPGRLVFIDESWTNGQVEHMNRTLKEVTVRRYYYSSDDQLREHIAAFVNACNYAKRLKRLKGCTPHKYIANCWITEPKRFNVNPNRRSAGLNI